MTRIAISKSYFFTMSVGHQYVSFNKQVNWYTIISSTINLGIIRYTWHIFKYYRNQPENRLTQTGQIGRKTTTNGLYLKLMMIDGNMNSRFKQREVFFKKNGYLFVCVIRHVARLRVARISWAREFHAPVEKRCGVDLVSTTLFPLEIESPRG